MAFFNASTTGGNIEVAEIQAQILHRYGVRSKCIILGVHPFLMMEQAPPPLAKSGYLPHVRISDVLSLSDQRAVWQETNPILQMVVLPLKTHADRLNKLLRIWIFEAQNQFRTKPLPRTSYEYFAKEFTPGANAHYDGTHSSPDDVAATTRMRYETFTFNSTAPEISLKRALALFHTEASLVVVVTMPTKSSLREFDARGSSSYQRVLSESNVPQIDCSKLVADKDFIDDVHLDGRGRQILSNAVGRILAKIIANESEGQTCDATVVEPPRASQTPSSSMVRFPDGRTCSGSRTSG
ncbi:hypothetical protein ACFPFP_32240 [Bradyrhizobium sp. GCM10023182]|uniref:SGNH/GDSL hydrolase family protein n=1 Tax=Bradyrhizobium zhengyangense TaxID=2911009 RepID=A0ABS9LX69_9BRAD|nr:hypothetical protein [Bradyrhizobium zhengyangense]MCG2671609.1 hypothetical protein [Bradyrhizobium zhengyangense]